MVSTITSSVTAPLNFYLPGGEGTETVNVNFPKNKGLKFNTQQVSIEDARGREKEFSLDKNGFQFLNLPTDFTDFTRDDAIKDSYYKEVESFLMSQLKASKVYAINHVLRSSTLSQTGPATETPASFIHCDWSYRGAEMRLNEPLLPLPWKSGAHSPTARWAAYSLWRPLTPVTRDALALGDKSTIHDTDLQPYDLTFPNGAVIEGASLKHRDSQKFVHWGGMQVGEVILIKLFDSETDGRARCTPHTAFKAPGDYGEARRSVECRVVVFWDE